MVPRAAIYSLAFELPEQIRTNDWWSPEVVSGWTGRLKSKPVFAATNADSTHPGERRIAEEMARVGHSPFLGCERRHAFGANENIVDLEFQTAQKAIRDAGITAEDIDFFVTYSMVPEFLHTCGNGPWLHSRLGLREDCQTTFIEAGCRSFLAQLEFADLIFATGRARYGLLLQTSAISRLLPRDDQSSVIFGDAVSAQVVGPARDEFGLLASSHLTDGSVFGAAVTSVRGKPWHDDGVVTFHSRDKERGRRMFSSMWDFSNKLCSDVIAKAGATKKDVAFFASHQATAWLQLITKEAAGLDSAVHVDTFPFMASLTSVNVPASLAVGLKEGRLKDGNLVVMFTGASGQVVSASAFRWGGRAL